MTCAHVVRDLFKKHFYHDDFIELSWAKFAHMKRLCQRKRSAKSVLFGIWLEIGPA